MDNITHSLYAIIKDGCPTSYIKGIRHGTNNVCSNTLLALLKSHIYFHETSFIDEETYVYLYKLAFNSEFLLNRLALKCSVPIKIHLDGFARKSLLKYDAYIKEHCGDNIHFKLPKEYSFLKDEEIDLTDTWNEFKKHPTLYKYGLLERNIAWMKIIKLFVNKLRSFICCGLAHVPDLLQRLKKEGFTIKPIDQGKMVDPKDINFDLVEPLPNNKITTE